MRFSFDSGIAWDSGWYFDGTDTTDPPVVVGARAVTGNPVSRLSVLDTFTGPVLRTWGDTDGAIERGSVTYERTRTARRRADVTIANHDGSLTPQEPGDLFYPGAIVRIERGVRVDGVPDYLTLATIVVRQFSAGMDGRLRLVGDDPLSLLAQPFGDAVVIPAGTAAEDAVRQLWAPVLDPVGGGASWPLDAGGRLLPLRAFLPDEDRLDAVVRYLAASGLEVYSDRLGRPLLRPAVDVLAAATVATVRDFKPGADAVLLSWERTGGRRAYNRVIVESNAPAGPAIRVVVTVDDPASPLHPDRIGLQTAPVFRSAQVPDLGAAIAVGRRLLAEYALATDSTSGTAVPDVTVDAGDIVWIEEPVSGTSGRYRLDSLTLPVVTGSMSLSASKVVPLLLTGDDA